MVNLILVVVLLAIIGGAAWYVRKEKKKGVHCIGCPHAGECARKAQGGCH